MQKVRQILLFLKRGYSLREIAKQTKVSRPTVHLYASLFNQTGKSHHDLWSLTDIELKSELGRLKSANPEPQDPRRSDFISQVPYFLSELKRVGVTRQLLWQEYLQQHPSEYQYSRFCELLEAEMARRKPAMHLEHKPAEMLEVDFAGSTLQYIDPDGQVIDCPVFIAVLPFSGYTYVRALINASLPHLIDALNEMLVYFGGVPMNVISDNMKQWVTRSSRYEPAFTEMLEAWALHNHIGLLATRRASPKDKPSVEGSVLIAYRRIYALLRNETFRSLNQLNQAIMAKLEMHHLQNFQKKTYSRKDLFIAEEQPLLQALPHAPYEMRHCTKAKVQKNYHVVLGEDWHFYSVPHTYLGKEVNLIYSSEHVEIYDQLERIAIHSRSYKAHGYTTVLEHMPEHHRIIAEQRGWNPEHYLDKAKENGPCTHQFFLKLMESKITIHQAYGPCLGIIRLISSYNGPRVESACKRALGGNKYNYGVIKSILENKMDLDDQAAPAESPIPKHNNVRGPQAYSIVPEITNIK